MDNINIEIQSSSENAEQGVNTLIETLSTLNEKLEGVQGGVDKYVKKMQNLANITSKIKIPDFSKMNIFNIFKRPQKEKQNPLQNINFNNKNDDGGDSKSKKAQKNISEVNSKLRDLVEIAGLARQSINSTFKTLGKIITVRAGLKGLNMVFGDINSKVSGLSSGFKILAKNLSKYSLALFGIRSAFYAVRNTSNEFLSSQDAVAKQLNANISYLKFAIGSMFAPIIEYLTNLMYKLLQVIQYIVYYFTRINIFAGKTAKSYAAMGNSASKTAKELNKQLQVFDELNNINLDRNSGSGGGAGADVPSFDLSQINEGLKPLFDDIDNLGKNLAEKINKALASIEWDKIIEKTTSATKKIANILNDFTSNLDFKLIGYTIAEGFNTVFANLNTFFSTYDFNTLGKKLGEAINSIIVFLDWEALGKSMTNGFKAAIDVLFNLVTTVEWGALGDRIGRAIKSGFDNINWQKVGQTINIGVNGILDAIIRTIDAMDVNQIAQDIQDALSEIDFGEIFTKVLTIAAKAVEGLGKILWMSVFSGDGDLARILFLIIDVTLLTKLFKMLFKALGQKAMTGLVESMGKAKTASSDLTTTLNGTTKATSGLSTGFNNLLTSLGKSVEIIAVFGGIRMVIDGLTGLLTAFAESGLSVGEALSFLAGTLGVITLSFTAMMGVMTMMQPSWQSIAGAAVILAGFALVLRQVTGLIQALGEAGIGVNEVIGMMAGIATVIVALMASIAVLGPAMTAGLVPFLAVVAGISTILLVMKATIPTILNAATRFVQGTAPSIIKVIDAISRGIEKIINALGKVLPPIIDAVGRLFDKIFNGIATVVRTIGNTIINVFKGVGSVLDTIFKGIARVFDSVFNGMGNVARAIGSVITNIFNGISNVVRTVGKAIEGVLKTIGWLIENTLNALLRFAWQIGPAIENSVYAITRAVTRLVNFVVSALQFLVNNTVIRAINGIIDTLNKLPMFSISRKSNVYLPRFSGYEDGGYPKEADFFYANENGIPEMIGRIGNRTAVANNDQITKAIADATYSAFVQALGENSGNSNQPLNIYIGNDKVYKGYTKHQSQMSNQYGVVV